jgi:surface-anchored protein
MKTTIWKILGALSMSLPLTAATLTSGHVDFIGIGYKDGGFEPHSHAEAGAIVDGIPLAVDTEYELGELDLLVVGTSIRPADTEWSPVGVASGLVFWTLPQVEIAGQPFVGVGAEELEPSEWTGPIRVSLISMSAPLGAQFSLWQTDSFDVPTFFMSTFDGGITAADFFQIDAGDHAHFGWGFTELGVYDLEFEISGTHAVDGPKSTTATYRFHVIPEPSAALMSLLGGLFLLRRRRA